MSIATPTNFTPHLISVPQSKRWTVAEFHAIYAEPCFQNRKMILVEGEILEMPNPNPPHDVSLGLSEIALRILFGQGFWIRGQMSLILGASTDPLPDLAVVAGSPRDFMVQPRTALLVVEISDSTLAYDTRDKANLYAAAGIQDYWVVDLVHRALIVFRDPAPDGAQVFGAAYRSKTTLDTSKTISPLAATTGQLCVAELLP